MKIFINNSRLTILISLAFLIMGGRGLWLLQRESIPPVDFARAVITTIYPGSSPVEVEEQITKKIEDEIRSVEHLKEVKSLSLPGLSLINIRMDIDRADTTEVVNKLHQSLQNVKGLPPEVLDPPKLTHFEASRDDPIIRLYITGPSQGRLRDKISWDLKTELERIPGVLEVQMGSYKKREFIVLLSQEKMERHHISSAEVISALQQKKQDIPAGYLESSSKRNLVRLMGRVRSVKELENTIIRSNFSGKKILIQDIAQVQDGFEKEERGEFFYHPKEDKKLNPASSLILLKTKRADTLNLLSRVQKKLEIFKNRLKGKYKILTGFNEGESVKNRLSNVINNALTGFALIFIVFFLFLPSRLGLMASLSLPLAVLGTFSFFPFMNISFNVITMLAFVICIGMLVDNSVVVSEYYSRLVTEEKQSPSSAAWQAVCQFRAAISASVFTTIAAFLPMLVTTGVMGQFVQWIPLVVTLALLMSLFESFCLLPGRLKWLSPKKPGRPSTFIKYSYKLEIYFEKALKKIIAKKYISLAGIFLLMGLSFALFIMGSKIDLFAVESPEYYRARLEPKPNSPFRTIKEQTKRIAHKMQEVFEKEEAVQWLSARWDAEKAEILLKIKASARRKIKYKDSLNKLRAIDPGDLKSLNFGIMAGGPPTGQALSAVFQSHSRKDITNFIQEIFPKIKKIPGLVDLKIRPDPDKGKEYKIKTRPETLARLGLDLPSLGLALRTALEGHLITEITENNESFYIRVRKDKIASLKDLKKIKITERFGRLVPLGSTAEIKQAPSEPDRVRNNFSPALFLEASVDPKQTTSIKVNQQAKKIIEEHIKNYPSLAFRLIGEQETTEESLNSLFNAAILAVFAIFVILIILFKSFLLSFLVLTCIPLGLIGVIWAFFLHGRPLSFFAMIGVVGLAGVVVNSAIILISFILSLKKEEKKPLAEIALKASKMRFRPIMITNLTTMGGLFPTAYGIAGFEPMLQPMTLALFWGLFSATFLTLIWVPCALLAIEDGKKLWAKLTSKKSSLKS